ASLLKRASWLRMTTDYTSALFIYRHHTPHRQLAVPTPTEMRESGQSLRNCGSRSASGSDWLLQILSKHAVDVDSWPSAGELATASQRLVPSDSCRTYLAMDLAQRGMPYSAMRIYSGLLAHGRGTVPPTIIWSNIGFCYDLLNQEARALDAKRT